MSPAGPARITAVFGGSFNPPHVGHGLVASWLRWTGRAEDVWFVPACEHAFGKPLAPFHRRVAAVDALAGLLNAGGPPWALTCDIELGLPRPSYTIATLDALRERHPDRRFRLVVGSDVRQQLPMWKDHERVLAEYDPIVVGRVGYPEVDGAPTFPDLSSTVIRERLTRGLDVSGFIPRAVLEAWEG